ncbi:MraY family glycosyltransferase [Streptomyces sp. A012304]|uniref:MraY family glycosyltransferase n=1 Tax=Streptomyces sp. A012304 TaxID=375446 RepID=UPI0022319793|nr:undecaprenyl/decaprenyl-phosphate alpha-N-acetylglucosaminyl 1-phosphate transferase [Streptomyces sp. A012304]GKQ39085.1 putative glycosyltransferase [Streptomyces sp. A012304]
MSVLYGIAAATAALLLAAVLAALLRVPALRVGLVDRRQRQRRVPLSGGAAVVLATCLVAGTGDWTGIAPLGDGMGVLLATAAGVAGLGLLADVWRLKTRLPAFGTALAAAFVVPYGDTGPLVGAVAVGWIVLVALGFRALDHADGVAGTVGVVTAFGVAACAAAEVMDGLAVLLSVLAAALTGFLMHNWPPARVALGGCGSLFAGFLLAAAAVIACAGQDAAAGTGVLFALTAVAALDVVLVLVGRRLAGRPLLRGGPDHLAHRLRRLGLTPQGAVVLVGVGAFAGVLVGTLVHAGWTDARAALWVAGGALVLLLGLLRVPTYGPRRHGDELRRQGDGARRHGDGLRRRGDGPRRSGGEAARRLDGGSRRSDAEVRRSGDEPRRSGDEPRRSGDASRRQGVSSVRPPRRSVESPSRAPRRLALSQVSAGLRVRNG